MSLGIRRNLRNPQDQQRGRGQGREGAVTALFRGGRGRGGGRGRLPSPERLVASLVVNIW